MADGDPHVTLEAVRMGFGNRIVFPSLSCGFPRGRISVILGGSGSGKSTILRLVAGLVRPQAGRVIVAGEEITALGERALVRVRRRIGMMFQGGALLDSLTVFDNCAFPLREHTSLSAAAIAAAVHARLAAVGLHDVDALLPGQLSGGMLKRAALARAMMLDPVILLCDEPFSGLDPLSVRRIERLLVETNQRLGITMLVVSHDVGSTMRIGGHVVLLLGDRVVSGSPADLATSPDPAVRAFLGEDPPEAVA